MLSAVNFKLQVNIITVKNNDNINIIIFLGNFIFLLYIMYI